VRKKKQVFTFSNRKGILIKCSECKNKYRIHMKIPKIRCPICNAMLVLNWDRIKNPDFE